MSAQEHVRGWLRALQTGCGFAKLLANDRAGISWVTFNAVASPEELDPVFDLAAAGRLPVIAVLPFVRTEAQLADQLLQLATAARWKVLGLPVPSKLTTDDVFVGLEWQTPAGHWASPMGLGPFGTMPATRRAPYTCIAVWPGGHDNQFRRGKVEPVVHFLDVDLSRQRLDAAKYKAKFKQSQEATRALLFDDDANNYRNVAFRLSAAVERKLARLTAPS